MTEASTVSPLDGGWGWFIVLGCCINNFLTAGYSRTFGVLFNAFKTHFNTSATTVAFMSGLTDGIRFLGGPIVTHLFVRLNGRLLVMFGGIMVGVGFVGSAFVPNPYFLLFTYSILAGVGCCCVYTPSYVIVNQYFDKRRGKALGLGTIGSGLGAIALAPLNVYLLSEYGFSGAMMILGGIMLNNCVAGALYRPIEHNRQGSSYEKLPDITESNVECLADKLTENKKRRNYGGTSNNAKYDPTIETKSTEIAETHSLLSRIRKKFEIFTYLSFVIYFFQVLCLPLCLTNYYMWLPIYAQEKGETASSGALLVSAAGGADIIGRLVGGAFFDIPVIHTNMRPCHAVLALAMAGCVIETGLVESYGALLSAVIVYGLVEGAFHSQLTSIAAQLAPNHLMAQAVGYSIFGRGFFVFLGPILGGAIIDTTGTCRWNFILNGGLFGFFSLLVLLDYFCRQQPSKVPHRT